MQKFVVLRSIETGRVFWSTYDGGDPERLVDGTKAYEFVAYADLAEEALQIACENDPGLAVITAMEF